MTRAAATLRKLVKSFSARLNESFLTMACAEGAGMLHASSRRSGARNTSSGEPNSFNKRADSRAAMPGVNVNAIHDGDESSSIEKPHRGAYAAGNSIVKSICENLSQRWWNRGRLWIRWRWFLRIFVRRGETNFERCILREIYVFPA